jgi:phosphate acetyltransferase
MKQRAIYIGATGQHVGKTTCCLGILSGLTKRISSPGFIKPVGQMHVRTEGGTHVDKDVVLFKEQFQLSHAYSDMSPILLPKGFTRDYLDGRHNTTLMEKTIVEAFSRVSRNSDFTLVEGTGHIGVGSIVGLNNAHVARLLGLDILLIAQGGLGSTIDELALNISLCRQHNVRVRGVIVNRVLVDKQQMIQNYLPKALARWNIPLMGCIPFDPILDRPTMRDFEGLFKRKLLTGRAYEYRRFERHRLGARSLDSFRDGLRPRELTIAPASREDLIEEILSHHMQGRDFEGGMILTGRRSPSSAIVAKIRESQVPILYVPVSSYSALKMITGFTAKIRKDDRLKVKEAIRLVERHVDFSAIL